MTTDQLPQVRSRGLGSLDSLGDGREDERNRPQIIKRITSPIGTRVEVQRWKNKDGTEGNSQLRLSRSYYHKGSGETRWENITLKSEDLFFMAKVIEAMANQGLLPIGEEFRFD